MKYYAKEINPHVERYWRFDTFNARRQHVESGKIFVIKKADLPKGLEWQRPRFLSDRSFYAEVI